MNTNMAGFRYFFKNDCVFVLWKKVALALEGLTQIICKTFVTCSLKKYIFQFNKNY